MAKKIVRVSDGLEEAVGEAARVLREGGIVVFPTETVYGIGVLSDRATALEKLRELKQRSIDKPFQLLVADREMARKIGAVFSSPAARLANAFWPGPLTLVVPDGTDSGGTLGIRVPNSPFTLALCREVNQPVISSSANRAGDPPPCDGMAADAFGVDVDLLVDAGPIVDGLPSTVVDCTGDDYRILRAGGVSEDAVASAWMS